MTCYVIRQDQSLDLPSFRAIGLATNVTHDRPAGKANYILAKASFAKDFAIAKNVPAFPVGVNAFVR